MLGGGGWWGLVGVAGVVGLWVFVVIRRRGRRAAPEDPLANYPSARLPCVPHPGISRAPLMSPAGTPDAAGNPARRMSTRRMSAVEAPPRRTEVPHIPRQPTATAEETIDDEPAVAEAGLRAKVTAALAGGRSRARQAAGFVGLKVTEVPGAVSALTARLRTTVKATRPRLRAGLWRPGRGRRRRDGARPRDRR